MSRSVYGLRPVLEALSAHPADIEHLYVAEEDHSRLAEVVSRARHAQVRVERVSRDRLQRMAEGGLHQGVVAQMREWEYAELSDLLEVARSREQPPLVVVLDGIQDPHNLGAIVRSAHALGAHGVVIGKDRSAQVTGAVVKASAGATEHTRIARVTNLSRALEELKEAGLWVAAADPTSDQLAWDARLDGPLAVVVGAEGKGVRENVLNHCDLKVRIPMAGELGSLNASVSAGVMLYEIARQRGRR